MHSRNRLLCFFPILVWICGLSRSAAQDEAVLAINTTSTYETLCENTTVIADCAKRHRECTLDNVTQEEICGPCVADYVEFRTERFTRSNASLELGLTDEQMAKIPAVVCFPVSNITMELFLDRFDPIWVTEKLNTTGGITTNASSANLPTLVERLAWLKAMAALVVAHNRQQPPPSFELGLNALSADSIIEQKRRLGYQLRADGKTTAELMPQAEFIQQELPNDDYNTTQRRLIQRPLLPPSVDWQERGAVTSVKDQGVCGCCWSISVAGAVEGAAAITSNYTYLQSVSFQQLISCEQSFSLGCNGGFTSTGLVYAVVNQFGGMATLNHYEFTDGRTGETTTQCQTQDQQVAVTVGEPRYVVTYSTSPLPVADDDFDTRLWKMKRGLQQGPVSIAMMAECPTMYQYRRGVITDDGECACGPSVPCLNHAVLLVGYSDNPDNGDPPYWKIKNSWGRDWGESGFFRVSQQNPKGDSPNSWGLFGILAEGTMPMEAFNQTAQVYDEPQQIGLTTGQIVLIVVLCVVVAALIGAGLAWILQRKSARAAAAHGQDGS